jgi:hypothetical protein
MMESAKGDTSAQYRESKEDTHIKPRASQTSPPITTKHLFSSLNLEITDLLTPFAIFHELKRLPSRLNTVDLVFWLGPAGLDDFDFFWMVTLGGVMFLGFTRRVKRLRYCRRDGFWELRGMGL